MMVSVWWLLLIPAAVTFGFFVYGLVSAGMVRESAARADALLHQNRKLGAQYENEKARTQAAINDALCYGGCEVCRHYPGNGGECPGMIDCESPDAPLAEFFHRGWRGPCAANRSERLPGKE